MTTSRQAIASEMNALAADVVAELRRAGHKVTGDDEYAVKTLDGADVRFRAWVVDHAFGGVFADVHYYARRRVTLNQPVGGWDAKRIAELLVAAAESRRIAEAMRQEAGNAHANRVSRQIAVARDAGINREDVYEDADGTYTIKLRGLSRDAVIAVGKAIRDRPS